MANRSLEYRVGIFSLLGLAATVVAIFVLSPDLFNQKEMTPYYTILQDASGILEKTHVKTNGVTIGKVTKISLSRDATRVDLEVEKEVFIPEGSKIIVRTVGFLGDKFIEIKRPSNVENGVGPNGFIAQATDASDLQEVISLVGSIAEDIKKVTTNLSGVLGDQQGQNTMANIVDNFRQFTGDARGILEDNRDDLREMVSNIREFSAVMKETMNPENRDRIERILANFDESMEEVKGATENINLISEKVEKGEGTLGRLINESDTVDDIQGALSDLRQVLAPIAQVRIAVDTHSFVRRDDTTQTYFNLLFRTRPDSFYVLGFTDFTDRTIDTSTQVIDGDNSDGTTRIRESIVDQKALRFNAQIGKRWGPIGARLGLFESTGGVAGDLYLWNNRFRAALEVYDFADKDSPLRDFAHVRAWASILFFNHIYAMAGIDDPTRLDPETGKRANELNYFFGAGLTFNDDDIRSLLGLAAISGGVN